MTIPGWSLQFSPLHRPTSKKASFTQYTFSAQPNNEAVSLQTYPTSFRFLFFNNLVLVLFIWSGKLTVQVSGINSDNRQAVHTLSPEWLSIHQTVSPLHATLAAMKAEVDPICVLWNIPQHRFLSWFWFCKKKLDR